MLVIFNEGFLPENVFGIKNRGAHLDLRWIPYWMPYIVYIIMLTLSGDKAISVKWGDSRVIDIANSGPQSRETGMP